MESFLTDLTYTDLVLPVTMMIMVGHGRRTSLEKLSLPRRPGEMLGDIFSCMSTCRVSQEE